MLDNLNLNMHGTSLLSRPKQYKIVACVCSMSMAQAHVGGPDLHDFNCISFSLQQGKCYINQVLIQKSYGGGVVGGLA